MFDQQMDQREMGHGRFIADSRSNFVSGNHQSVRTHSGPLCFAA